MKILTFIISLFIYSQSFASEQVFDLGNRQYMNENYSAAISLYDSILSSGLESSELHYNLGNCYYKTKDWASAIWHYEKSLQLKNNTQTINNLELTRLNIIDRIQPIPKLFYQKWWNNFVRLLSTKTWQILTIIWIWIILIVSLINIFINFKASYLKFIFFPLTIFLVIISSSSIRINDINNEAIIFASVVSVNSAPTESSTNLFALHSGTKIELIDQIESWVNIKITDGRTGWIEKNKCKIIK